jgi:predicted site-specific integrase-resolvase
MNVKQAALALGVSVDVVYRYAKAGKIESHIEGRGVHRRRVIDNVQNEKLYNVEDICVIMKRSKWVIYRMLRHGRITGKKIGKMWLIGYGETKTLIDKR